MIPGVLNMPSRRLCSLYSLFNYYIVYNILYYFLRGLQTKITISGPSLHTVVRTVDPKNSRETQIIANWQISEVLFVWCTLQSSQWSIRARIQRVQPSPPRTSQALR